MKVFHKENNLIIIYIKVTNIRDDADTPKYNSY